MNTEQMMSEALYEAKKAEADGEVPIGAIIVANNKIISRGYNLSIASKDPTAHAEIIAIRKAAYYLENYRLTDVSIFITLEPCAMCFGAIIHSRISKVFFGAYDPKTGVCGSCVDLNKINCFDHVPEVRGGILEKDCGDVIRSFFKSRRS